MKNYFSSNLKKLLKVKGVNQQNLANFVGVKQTSISNWINEVSSPDVNDLLKIYQYLGIDSLDNLILKNLEVGDVKLDRRLDNNISSVDELFAAKDKIIKLQDEKIEVLENELNSLRTVVQKKRSRA